MAPVNTGFETISPDVGFSRVRKQRTLCRALNQMILRRRRHAAAHINTFVTKLPPELEIRMELGPNGNTPPRIVHSASEVITGCDARHPNRSQQTMHEGISGTNEWQTRCARGNPRAATPASLKHKCGTSSTPREAIAARGAYVAATSP